VLSHSRRSHAAPVNHDSRYAYWNHRSWFYRMDSVPFDEWAIDRNMAMQPALHISAHEAGKAIRALDLTPHCPTSLRPHWRSSGNLTGQCRSQMGIWLISMCRTASLSSLTPAAISLCMKKRTSTSPRCAISSLRINRNLDTVICEFDHLDQPGEYAIIILNARLL
jgi:hypothetical protein